MLISFSVANFLSYNEKQTLKMTAGKLRTKKEHLYENREKGNILKFAAVYGANSAGKSNLFKAMNLLRGFILTGKLVQNSGELWCMTKKENKGKTTLFEISFLLGGIPYTYGLEINLQTQLVESERLFYEKKGEKKYLFKKESSEKGFEFYGVLSENAEIKVLGGVFSSGESPFLYCMNHNTANFYSKNPNAEILQKIFSWFLEEFEVIYPEQPINDTALLDGAAGLESYARLLSEFKTGISEIEEEPASEDKVKNSLSILDLAKVEFQMDLVKKINRTSPQKRRWSATVRSRANIFTIRIDENGNTEYHVLKFVHRYGEEKASFEMRRESDGTYRLFQLLDVLLTSKNKIFVIDEISRCMHPLLTIKFVEKFLSLCRDRNVQLIVTTHETRLMSHRYLRRDELWNCLQNENGESLLESFDRHDVRIDKVLDENYLKGNFGGIPFKAEDKEEATPEE